MSPFPNIFEGFWFKEKKEKSEVATADKEKLAELSDHVDYEAKMKEFEEYLDDVEQGKFEERYFKVDEQIRVRFEGDPHSSFVSIENVSPLLPALKQKLLELGYESHEGSVNTVFSKIFEDRKSSGI